MDLRSAIAAVEAATGGTVCFHDFDGSVAAVVGEGRISHRTPVCARAKAAAGGRCTACDLHASQARLTREPDGFWKLCHAGLIEAYVPLRSGGRNLGALFLGPWRWEGRESTAWAMRQDGPSLDVRGSACGPTPDADSRARCLALARLLAAAVAAAAGARDVGRVGRRERILRLIDEHLHGRFTLRQLAAELGLSPSRCGHVVRAETGRTFPALLEERRLAQARGLLLASTTPVARVAARCGFASASYFARRFRRAVGLAPEEFRRRGPA